MKKQADRVVEFNKRHITRIYPKGTRIGSSNFNPTQAWNSGCQIVSLNYQNAKCQEMRYHNIRFEENGNCGYILKPEFLCLDTFLNFCPTIVVGLKPTHELNLEILSAEMLPKPQEQETGSIIDPVIVLRLFGCEHDEKVHKTKAVWNNGQHPTWFESFQFEIHCLPLAYLHVAVYDKQSLGKDVFICENYLPLRGLRSGFRSIPLRQDTAQTIDGCHLLVKAELRALA